MNEEWFLEEFEARALLGPRRLAIDVGANIEPKPHHLAQYGVMGRVFAQKNLGIENPRVALMNVGGGQLPVFVGVVDAL